MPRSPRLVVIDPGGTRREVPISPLPFRIGRQAGNELLLRDTRISRHQAQILAANGALVLEDLGSRHGTFVNGQKILRHTLAPNDAIDFGMQDSFRLIFVGEGASLEELLEKVESPAPAHTGSRELYHLGVLLEVARTLGTGLSLEDILTTVVDAAIRLTRTERGVLLLGCTPQELQPAVARTAQQGTILPAQLQISRGVLRRVVEMRHELVVSDAGEETAMAGQDSVARLQLHTIVAIPVEKLPLIDSLDATITTCQGELLGVLYLDSHAPSSAFSELDREVLRTLAREAATVIENARLFAASRAKARLDHELEIASQIQRQLTPQFFPESPEIVVAGSTLACQSVGGDCIDVVPLSDGRHGFFVGDVAGKGISAAMLAMLLQGMLFTTATLDIPPEEVVNRINHYLCARSFGERYATMFYAVLHPAGKLDFVNAGHVPPLVRRRAGGLEVLSAGNVPVGIFDEAQFLAGSALLEPGDFLVIYSDGVSEASNLQGELFEEARLRKILEEFKGETAGGLLRAIQEGMKAFTQSAPQADDITLLVAQYRGKPA